MPNTARRTPIASSAPGRRRCGRRRRASKPSEYFRENVYTTFQDDWVAFQMTKMVNPERLMWANDFPHSDATWPNSQAVLAEHTARLTDWEKRRILHDNVAELFGIE